MTITFPSNEGEGGDATLELVSVIAPEEAAGPEPHDRVYNGLYLVFFPGHIL